MHVLGSREKELKRAEDLNYMRGFGIGKRQGITKKQEWFKLYEGFWLFKGSWGKEFKMTGILTFFSVIYHLI